jgi:hypothetical protein
MPDKRAAEQRAGRHVGDATLLTSAVRRSRFCSSAGNLGLDELG